VRVKKKFPADGSFAIYEIDCRLLTADFFLRSSLFVRRFFRPTSFRLTTLICAFFNLTGKIFIIFVTNKLKDVNHLHHSGVSFHGFRFYPGLPRSDFLSFSPAAIHHPSAG
jgi:hypothetical protein